MSKKSLSVWLVAGAAIGLSGCMTAAPPSTFDLVTAAADVQVARSRATIVVAEPTSVQTLGSERLVVRSAGGELSFLPGTQFTDSVPRLVQTKIIESFENSGFPSVGQPADRLSADFTIVTNIRAFEIVTDGGVRAVVEISAKLLDERDGRIASARVFSAERATTTSPASDAVAALDAALGDVLRELVTWASKAL